ncbi:MAG TPA: MnhB domain-containing protein [Stellaceae bacterium]|nr:MnhB domain-containing protein [Stellaceae bacterium]
MPAFGDHPLPYGDAINALAPIQRHVTNMVSAVNFDYRGLDTLGEESMLLAAVTGASILLRGNRGEGLSARAGEIPDRPISPRSEVLAPLVRLIGPVTTIFGLYVGAHAMTTPGGGFQGGVIIASGLLLIFLGQDYRVWRRIVKSEMMDACEGAGAALYGLAGFASMSMGATFLTNILPLGQLTDVFSGGLMLVENAGVALAVAGGFTVLLIEFLEETRAENGEGAP